MKVKFNIKGVIVNSDNPKEKFIKILDDQENTGGFLVLLSENGNFSFPHGHDEWVEDLETLEEYLKETNWIVQWYQ